MAASLTTTRYRSLKPCDLKREVIAKYLKLDLNFIIEQEFVQIDAAGTATTGAYGAVSRAIYHGAPARLKCIHKFLAKESALGVHRFLQECRFACQLRHQNVVHFYGVVMEGYNPLLVMEELICSLSAFITEPQGYIDEYFEAKSPEYNPESKLYPKKEIKESYKNDIALGVAQGLKYLHTKKPYPIVHRDLSSNNILLGHGSSTRFVAKIADFGLSKEMKSVDSWSCHNPGTLYYLPPEVMLPGEYSQLQATSVVPTSSSKLEFEGSLISDTGQGPAIREPDDVKNDLLPAQQKSFEKPQLKTSIDMYMYGVMMIELSSQKHPLDPQDKSHDSWHSKHLTKLECLTKERDSILHVVAKKCILENPDERASAADIVNTIAKSITPGYETNDSEGPTDRIPSSDDDDEDDLIKQFLFVNKEDAPKELAAASGTSSLPSRPAPTREPSLWVKFKNLFKMTEERQQRLQGINSSF